MSELARAGLVQAVEIAEHAVGAALDAIEATVATAEKEAQDSLVVGEKSVRNALEELRMLQATLGANLKMLADAVTEAI